MNTITIEFCKEDRQRLDELIAFAGQIVGEMKTRPAEHPIDAPTAHLEIPEITQKDLDQLAAAEEAYQAAVAANTPEVKPVAFAEFQKVVTQTVAKGPKQKAAAKEIINEYAASVSEVPEDKRAEIMERLAKI